MQTLLEPERSDVTWSSIGGLFSRYRWLILGVFLVVVGGGWAVLQVFFTDLYETKSTLLVKVGRETSEVPATVVNGQLFSQGVRVQDINSEVQLLSSRQLVETVVDRIGPEKFRSVIKQPDSPLGYPKYWLRHAARWAKATYKEALIQLNIRKRLTEREEVILAVSDALKIEPIRESDVLVLKLRLPSPQLATEAADGILSEYLRTRASIRRNDSGVEFFAQEAQQIEGRLHELTQRRAAIRDKWNVKSASEERLLLLQQIADSDNERVKLDAEIRRLQRESSEILIRLGELPDRRLKQEELARNPALQSLKERITNLQMERARLSGRYQDDSETMRKLDNEIASLAAALRKEDPTVLASTTSEPNPVREDLVKSMHEHDIQIAGLQMQLARRVDRIQSLRSQVAGAVSAGDQIEATDREIKLAEQEYLSLGRRREEAQVSEGLDSSRLANVTIVAPPELPYEPAYPRKLFIMGILLPVGLVLGIGLAVLMESLNDRIRDEADVANLIEMPCLGSVSGLRETGRRVS
jgi:uncharacterized protein involved in exopolysaccharide biosynthesis